MPKLTNANRALLALDRAQALVDDTHVRVTRPMARQFGADDPHVRSLSRILSSIEAVLPDLEQWAEAETKRAAIEHEKKVEARIAANAAKRKARIDEQWRTRVRAQIEINQPDAVIQRPNRPKPR